MPTGRKTPTQTKKKTSRDYASALHRPIIGPYKSRPYTSVSVESMTLLKIAYGLQYFVSKHRDSFLHCLDMSFSAEDLCQETQGLTVSVLIIFGAEPEGIVIMVTM